MPTQAPGVSVARVFGGGLDRHGVLTKTLTPCPGCWPSFLPTCQLAGKSLWGRGADLELPEAFPGAGTAAGWCQTQWLEAAGGTGGVLGAPQPDGLVLG